MANQKRPEYQVEPTWLTDGIWERGQVTPWELLRICAWKSAKNVALLSINTEDEILGRTSETIKHLSPLRTFDALAPEPDWEVWQDQVAWAIGDQATGSGLLGLHGVGYPAASAVLCILNPHAFPVIDKWTIAALYGPNERPQSHYRAAAYAQFAQALAARGYEFPNAENIHEIDQHLMNTAMTGYREDQVR